LLSIENAGCRLFIKPKLAIHESAAHFFKSYRIFLLLLVIAIATMITTMDNTPYQEMAYYKEWKTLIGDAKTVPGRTDTSGALQAGWAKVNITPASPTPTAAMVTVAAGRTRPCTTPYMYVRW
jgi:hypothetical protein